MPEALESRNLLRVSVVNFVNFYELSEAKSVERETGFEPATACLEGRNSTTELLPQNRIYFTPFLHARQRGAPVFTLYCDSVSIML